MSRTLNLVDNLLAMARNYQELHRDREAVRLLRRLASFPEMAAQVVEEVQLRLGEIYLRHKNYRRARRHLSVALLYGSQNPRYHFLLATAFDSPVRPDARRAFEHYRISIRLDPEQPRCLADYGLLALRLGKLRTGLTALKKAGQ